MAIKVPSRVYCQVSVESPVQHVAVWSVLSAHEMSSPSEMAVNEPPGGSSPPASLLPQQVMVWSVLNAHEWNLPAATAVKAPSGGSRRPSALLPQHLMV